MWQIHLCVRLPPATIEYVVGAEMDQYRIDSPAGQRKVSRPGGVHSIRDSRLRFALFHLVKGRGIDNYFRTSRRQYLIDLLRIRHVKIAVGQRHNSLRRERPAKIRPELSVDANDCNLHDSCCSCSRGLDG